MGGIFPIMDGVFPSMGGIFLIACRHCRHLLWSPRANVHWTCWCIGYAGADDGTCIFERGQVHAGWPGNHFEHDHLVGAKISKNS